MFRTFPLSVIRSFFTVHTAMVYVIRVCWQLASRMSANLYDIYHCCVYSKKNPDDGQRKCPKHVEFYCKNKFENLVHQKGKVIRYRAGVAQRVGTGIALPFHDRGTRRGWVISATGWFYHGNLSLRTITWTSNLFFLVVCVSPRECLGTKRKESNHTGAVNSS
jgi:hypothetical protein